jgi:hypothetical protein
MEVTSGAVVAGSQALVPAPHPVALYSSAPTVAAPPLLPPISSLKPAGHLPPKGDGPPPRPSAADIGGPQQPAETADTCLNFFELYSVLGKENYAKMTTCSYCGRRFRFVSVLLEHLRCHVANVEKIVEMKMKIWVKRGNLKCGRPGCARQKYAYTLDYTRHRDSHDYVGLACDVCGAEQGSSPQRLAAHMAAAHEEYLFRMETQPEDIPGKQPESSVAVSPLAAAIPPGDSTAGAAANAEAATASVGSPLMYQPRSVGPPPPVSNNSMMYPLHMMVDVKTPKSAPPVLLDCSPGGSSMVSPSPQGGQQQPMSAPSLLYGGDETELDYGSNLLDHHQQQQQQVANSSMPSMPCLVGGEEEEDEGACAASAQNPPAPDVVNQHQPDSEYIMDILKDIEALGRTFFYSFEFILNFLFDKL